MNLPQETVERIEKEAKAWAINPVQKNGYINGAQSEALRNLKNEEEIKRLKEYLKKIIEVIDVANSSQQFAALRAIKALCQEGIQS